MCQADKTENKLYTDRVLTIHDYFDGLLLGVATLNGQACIYESDQRENADSSLFFLTPIDSAMRDAVLLEWGRWIEWVEKNKSANGWKEQQQLDLATIAKQSNNYRKYTRHGRFYGSYKNFHSHIDNLFVEWTEM